MGTIIESSIGSSVDKKPGRLQNFDVLLNGKLSRNDKTDEQLIAEYLNEGNEQAFNMIIKRYENIVFGLAYRIVGNHSLSEEVMQEVFLILTKKLSTFRQESKFSTWLYRVVVNVCYLYRKFT